METSATGFGLALLFSSFWFGFRHGIDWDHIAAITDITSSQPSVRIGLRFATLYAAGHGVVVFVIGVVAIALGKNLPESIDSAMGRVVGVTLIILGIYVIYALIRYREDFRLRSRWMLLFGGVRRAYRWARGRGGEMIQHEHSHLSHEGFDHHDRDSEFVGEGSASVATQTHTHSHTHTDPFMNYGTGTSLAVGMLHGVGAETPTQVLIFLTAARAGGVRAGIIVLAVFLLGLFAANTALALASASGFLAASKRFSIYAAVSIVTAVASLVLGVAFVFGQDSWLPVFFGG